MARLGPWRREFTAPLHVLQNELNRIFDEYWAPSRLGQGPTRPMDIEPSTWSPPVDVIESADAYVLWAEVPGVDPSSIDLSLTGNVLTLRGIKPTEDDPEPAGPQRERTFGPFHRQIVLAGEVDFDATQAEVRNGVLKIRFPKKEAAKPRTIPVQTH